MKRLNGPLFFYSLPLVLNITLVWTHQAKIMEEHFLRECKLQSSWWYSICQNYLQLNVIFDNGIPLCLSLRALVTLLKSWILLLSSCLPVPLCLLITLAEMTASQGRAGHVSTLQPLQANWESLVDCVESNSLTTLWLHSDYCLALGLSTPGKYQTFPPVTVSLLPPPTPGYANCIQKKPPRDPTLTEAGFNFTSTLGLTRQPSQPTITSP